MDTKSLTQEIKSFGMKLGFTHIGSAPPDVSIWGDRFIDWLRQGFQGEMGYMARDPERRTSLSSIFPGVKSIVVVSMNYYSGDSQRECLDNPEAGYIANYALNDDYHNVIESRLNELLHHIDSLTDGRVQGKIYVDTGPLLEKAFAVMGGVGWMGKHSLIISQDAGSWLSLGVLLLDIELEFDKPVVDNCGECTRCIEACPTRAIVAPYIVDARRCISYLLGELKSSIPLEMRPLIGNRIFGCDDCQWVCPWNNGANVSTEEVFMPKKELMTPLLSDFMEMDEDRFHEIFNNNPIRRIKWSRFLRNVAVAIGNSGDKGVIPVLERRLSNPDPVVREHVEWAVSRGGLAQRDFQMNPHASLGHKGT